MHLVDYPNEHPDTSLSVSDVAEEHFQEYYLRHLPGDVKFVLLESEFRFDCQDYMLLMFLAEMHRKNMRCDDLIEETAMALNENVLALMLSAVQRGNVELSVKIALHR